MLYDIRNLNDHMPSSFHDFLLYIYHLSDERKIFFERALLNSNSNSNRIEYILQSFEIRDTLKIQKEDGDQVHLV